MANKIIGRFYFKQTSNGNLIGEFSNNHSQNEISTESAELKGGVGNYIGQYSSTWQEKGQPCFSDLDISPKNGWNKIFSLKWSRSGNLVFEGEGMLCDNILIGDYRSV